MHLNKIFRQFTRSFLFVKFIKTHCPSKLINPVQCAQSSELRQAEIKIMAFPAFLRFMQCLSYPPLGTRPYTKSKVFQTTDHLRHNLTTQGCITIMDSIQFFVVLHNEKHL